MTKLMGPEEVEAALRAIGAARYHTHHRSALLHGGKLHRARSGRGDSTGILPIDHPAEGRRDPVRA